MSHPTHNDADIVRRGQAWYEQRIRPQVEVNNKGKFLVINTETGDYEIDADGIAAGKRAKTKYPDAPLFTMRIGAASTFRLGSTARVKTLSGQNTIMMGHQ